MISKIVSTQIPETENALSIVMTIEGKELRPRQGITFCSGISGKILGSERPGASFRRCQSKPAKNNKGTGTKQGNEHKLNEHCGRMVVRLGIDSGTWRKIDRPQKPKVQKNQCNANQARP